MGFPFRILSLFFYLFFLHCGFYLEGGYFYPPLYLRGKGGLYCLSKVEVEISGENPYLEGKARREILSLLPPEKNCSEKGSYTLRMKGLSVRSSTDVYGFPPEKNLSSAPPPGRVRVTLEGTWEMAFCPGEKEFLPVEAVGFLPYEGDSFRQEEGILIALSELSSKVVDKVLLRVREKRSSSPCGEDRKGEKEMEGEVPSPPGREK